MLKMIPTPQNLNYQRNLADCVRIHVLAKVATPLFWSVIEAKMQGNPCTLVMKTETGRGPIWFFAHGCKHVSSAAKSGVVTFCSILPFWWWHHFQCRILLLRDLTLIHWSGPTLFRVMVVSCLSSRTLSLVHLGSSLVQILMGTIQLGQFSSVQQTNDGATTGGLDSKCFSFFSSLKSNLRSTFS